MPKCHYNGNNVDLLKSMENFHLITALYQHADQFTHTLTYFFKTHFSPICQKMEHFENSE